MAKDAAAENTGEQQEGTAASGATEGTAASGVGAPSAEPQAQAGPRGGQRATDFPDIAGLPYEQAREELVSIVSRLEAGQVPLEDAMALWRRGEALAAHCAGWLADAQAEIEQTTRQD